MYKIHETQEENRSVDTLFLLRMGNKISMEGVTETKFGAEPARNDHPETAPLGDPSHKQSPNPETMGFVVEYQP